jgi:hypothetical protein
MQKLDMVDYNKTCPECDGIMGASIATRADMTGDPADDNTTLIEWWDCFDCGHYEEQV